MFTVLELSSRYPNEGGCYVWSKRAFGDFAGFITGWTYWTCNLPYFPGLFYFTASAALFLGGPSLAQSGGKPARISSRFSLIALGIAAGLNVRGLSVGKWLHNLGCRGSVGARSFLLMGLGLALVSALARPPAFTPETMVPSTRLKDIVFWSTIAFSLSGLESASMLGEEIRDARRNIPRAPARCAGVLITALYILGTVAMLVALPQQQILRVSRDSCRPSRPPAGASAWSGWSHRLPG